MTLTAEIQNCYNDNRSELGVVSWPAKQQNDQGIPIGRFIPTLSQQILADFQRLPLLQPD
jgi:hypothetical protein